MTTRPKTSAPTRPTIPTPTPIFARSTAALAAQPPIVSNMPSAMMSFTGDRQMINRRADVIRHDDAVQDIDHECSIFLTTEAQRTLRNSAHRCSCENGIGRARLPPSR